MRRVPLLCAVLLLLSPVASAAPGGKGAASKQNLCLQDEKCRDHYASADELYKAGKLQAAVAEYEAAYSEIQIPVFLYNLGRIHQRLGNLAKAAGYYRQFLGATIDEDPEPRARAKEYLSQVQGTMEETGTRVPVATAAAPDRTAAPGVTSLSAASTPPGEKKPLYKKWWFWTLTGGVVAGAAIGIGLAVGLSSQSQPGFPSGIPLITLSF